uniref:RING-type domain-containing protein n=1 Tax=Meloidogyne javanica TaxID=6303 RepID=A0A915MN13_MELJA
MSTSISDCMRELRALRSAIALQDRIISTHERSIDRLRTLVIEGGLRHEIMESWAEHVPAEQRFRRCFSPIVSRTILARRVQQRITERRLENKEAIHQLQLFEFAFEKNESFIIEQKNKREEAGNNDRLESYNKMIIEKIDRKLERRREQLILGHQNLDIHNEMQRQFQWHFSFKLPEKIFWVDTCVVCKAEENPSFMGTCGHICLCKECCNRLH